MQTNTSDKTRTEETVLLYQTRSAEVQEIIGKMPPWIIRWGITVIIMLVFGLFLGASLLRSPEVLNCPITIPSGLNTEIISSGQNGYVQAFMVKEDQTVSEGTLLAIMENNADYEAVMKVKALAKGIDTAIVITDTLSVNNRLSTTSLGELQLSGNALITAIRQFASHQYKASQSYQVQQNIRNYARQFLSLCMQWEAKYLILANTPGRITFLISPGAHIAVKANDPLIAISSENNQRPSDLYTSVAANAIKKIKKGQQLRLILEEYPAQEYGTLKGAIATISKIPVNGRHIVGIRLINGLNTSTNYTVPGTADIKAFAEIVVSEKSVLQKLLANTLHI